VNADPTVSSRERVARAFGQVLRKKRRAAGLTQEELMLRARLDRTYGSLLERGLRCPTLDVVGRLAAAMSIEIGDFAAEAWKLASGSQS